MNNNFADLLIANILFVKIVEKIGERDSQKKGTNCYAASATILSNMNPSAQAAIALLQQ